MSDTTLDGASVKEIRDLAQEAAQTRVTCVSIPGVESTIPIVTRTAGGGQSAIVDIHGEAKKWRSSPERREGVAKAFTLESFIDLVKRHADEHSAVFASIFTDNPSLTAVIDYHQTDGSPRFGKHRIAYEFPLSDEWTAWKGGDGVSMAQVAFAQLIEDRISELAAPYDAEKAQFEPVLQTTFANPNDVIRLARGLQVNIESKVAEARVLQTGETQISFEETHKDSDGKPLKVPGVFMLSIPLFIGGETIRIPARLRYRKDGGRLHWSYHLYRWREEFRSALMAAGDRVKEETGLPVFEGAPEA